MLGSKVAAIELYDNISFSSPFCLVVAVLAGITWRAETRDGIN